MLPYDYILTLREKLGETNFADHAASIGIVNP